MEDFSTPSTAATPWIANLATLAVVIAAIGWSSEQRPTPSLASDTSTQVAVTQPQRADETTKLSSTATPQGRWPSQLKTLPADGLQMVNLQTTTLR